MIASERSLTTAHQSQQRRNSVVLGKARNGATKPPVRPVKIYVIDPRKLQQRFDQKNQKHENETENEKQDSKEQEIKKSPEENQTKPPQGLLESKPLLTNTAAKSGPAKVLPTLAPKSTPVNVAQNAANIGVNNHENSLLGNGVTLQSLSCINGATLSIPALPLVVTNGVALIQPPISQSSIAGSGLFLPGITAITSVVGSDNIRSHQQQPQTTTKPRYAQKRKKKRKKVVKKRKLGEEKEKDEEDDGELSYLLKETTTRLGRISRPVSQPHSPSVIKSTSSSRATSPNSKVQKKVASKEATSFKCLTCSQTFDSKENLAFHLDQSPLHRVDSSQQPTQNFQETLTSTNSNVHGLTSISLPFSCKDLTDSAPTVISTEQKAPENAPATLHTNVTTGIDTNHIMGNSFDLCNRPKKLCDSVNFENLTDNTHRIFNAPATTTSYEKPIYTTTQMFGNDNHYMTNCASDGCVTSTSSVVQVASSYSIQNSPSSQCPSPGSPNNILVDETHLHGKQGTDCPLVVGCHSPVDPMLLHSRSPFPPPIPETSSHSVSASNLSIPEENLCKGELFMELGDGALDSTNLNTISPTPFRHNDSSIGQLFSEPGMKESTEESQAPGDCVTTPVDVEKRDCSASSGASIVTPMLLETTEDANDGEIFQTANYTRTFLHPSVISSANTPSNETLTEERSLHGKTYPTGNPDFPRTPQSACLESDVSMDSSETNDPTASNNSKCRSIWQFVKDQIRSRGISQACGEISEMADKLSRIARDHFIPIREEEIERLGNPSSIIHVDTPFFSHLLDLPFGMYIFKEDIGPRKKMTPPPMTSSELSFTGGVEDVEKFLPPDIDLISLPHLTNLDLN